MAVQMDPERRRKLAELARVHEEWQARHGIDDAEFTPDGAESDRRRSPTPEQEWELVRRTREVLGQDPETGHYLDAGGAETDAVADLDPAGPPLARTNHEAHLFMDLRPCSCGEPAFTRSSAVVTLPDGALASRYSGECKGCGRPREFLFRLPPEPLEDAGEEIRYGGAEPSRLLDAGEWLWAADRFAKAVPAEPHRLAGAEQRRARGRLAAAAAAIDEVLKFVPPDADSVPETAIRSELGRSAYAREPGRFRATRLVAVRDTYRRLLTGRA
jgi:hypothetical protein